MLPVLERTITNFSNVMWVSGVLTFFEREEV